jgi:DNA repair protein RadC
MKSASGGGGKVEEAACYRTSIKEWPEGDRPREKLEQKGASLLSEAELLAILIRAGRKGATALDLARKLLSNGRTLREIAQMSLHDLVGEGIGKARATSIVAACELSRRLPSSYGKDKPVFHCPEEVAGIYVPKLRDLKHEEFWSLLLTSANKLIAEIQITTGTLNSSLVHPRECFKEALKQSAATVIFLHNHPSGNPEPSQEDIAITKQLVESGKILGIPVHDHIIVAGNSFTSLADRGLV